MSFFVCERCDVDYGNKKGLIQHLQKKKPCLTINKNIEPEKLIEKLNIKEGLECNLCHRIYKNNSSLRTHKCLYKNNNSIDDVKYKEIKTQILENEILYNDIKEDVNDLKKQYQKILGKYTSTLKRHQYVKFNKNDPCFYIIENPSNKYQYKFGIAGTDETSTIDERLKNHRTLWPLLKVRYLLFIKDVALVEKSFKMMYDKEINPNGHEIIEGVSLDDMKKRIDKLLDILSITDYRIMSDEKIKEYNEYVNMTIKES
jgi:hypothetical protein